MSPRQRFTVTLMVGRALTREIDAADATQATAIAAYLYTCFGDLHFRPDAEEIVDIACSAEGEVAS